MIVWGTIESFAVTQDSILDIDEELGIRSGWLNIGRERQGLDADSGKYAA
jgi:hypothetical protein